MNEREERPLQPDPASPQATPHSPPWEWSKHGRFPQKHRTGPKVTHPAKLFFRFLLFFGFVTIFVGIGIGSSIMLITQSARGGELMLRLASCLLALLFPALAIRLAIGAFRRVARPLAEVMSAADAVADGDLSVRVNEMRPGEFGQLARSFNRMAAELEQSDTRRRNLTADVAHELRTPLQIIQGNLEGILDNVYTPDEAHIQDTLEETQLLARLVDDLQTLSLAEAGQLPLRMEPVEVGELLADVKTSFSGQAEAAGIALMVKMGEKRPLSILGDADRLNQVLGNLLVNALRHTPTGGQIELVAKRTDGGVTLAVADTGEGIAPDALPHVFDRFWKADKARAGEGTGLGLAIVKQLVVAHNGRIEVSSQPATGTTFTIWLPVEKTAELG